MTKYKKKLRVGILFGGKSALRSVFILLWLRLCCATTFKGESLQEVNYCLFGTGWCRRRSLQSLLRHMNLPE